MRDHARRRAAPKPRLLPLFLPATLAALALPVHATDYQVNNEADLRALLNAGTGAQNGDRVIFNANVTLTADLPAVQNNITIVGAGHTLSGNNSFRGLFIGAFTGSTQTAVSVAVQDLTISNTRAAGGFGDEGGGGGAGLGGAIFVADQATVTVSNVNLSNNAAVGGNSGVGARSGGGGMGGGANTTGGDTGGGGLGSGANGGDGANNGGTGIATGANGGGVSGSASSTPGIEGGGGGGGGNGGGGGVGGSAGVNGGGGVGGAGGFGGGGGSGAAAGGAGGFGGGGGSAITTGGAGGFGGGGGRGNTPGVGGFGGGNANLVNGGAGGAGMGGAIFVQSGGSLNLAGSLTINGNAVAGGSGVGGGGANGSAFGSGIFLQGGSGTLTFTPGAGDSQVVANTIADQTGSGGTGGNAGSYALEKNGAGTTTLSGANSYTGGTTVNAGTLGVSAENNLGAASGGLALNGATLQTTASFTTTRATTVSGGAAISTNAGTTLTQNGSVSGTGGLVKAGAGTLVLGNAGNNYSGGTTVNAGTLSVSADANLGNAAGGLTLNGATLQTTASFTTARAATLSGGAIISTNAGTTLTQNGAVGGTGGLVKTGTGTLVLGSAGNNYSGGTTVNAGTLSVSADANLGNAAGGLALAGGTLQFGAAFNLAGTRAITLNAGGGTIDTVNFSTTVSQGITGSGGLTKAGVGQLILTGASNYTGGTVINGGTLELGTTLAAGALAGSVANAGIFSVVNADTSGITSIANTALNLGTVFERTSSAGTMAITNTNGARALFNSNSTAGNATLTSSGAGSRVGFAGNSTAGNATVITNNGADVVFNDAASGGQARFVTNTGGSFDISSLTAGGTEVGSIEGAGAYKLGGKQLTVGASNLSATVSGVIADGGLGGGVGGSLLKTGSGNLNLTGANTYTGATSVNGGILSVNGSIASPVTVNGGGTLGGSGTINNTVGVAAGGVFAPGNSIGTITVNGNVTFAPGSIYRVEVDAAGNADRINVTGAPGTATINGGTVDVQAGAGNYQPNTQYTILNATGGVTGTFSAVNSNLAFLRPALSYDPNNVFLALTRNDVSFTAAGATPNQRAAGAALEASSASASGDMLTVVNTVTGLSLPQAQAAFDSIGGASLVALRRAGEAFAGGFGQQLNRRLGVVASGDAARQVATFGSPLLLAANDWQADGQRVAQAGMGAAIDGAQQRPDPRGFWLRGYGAGSNTDSDGNAAENTLRGGGISAGIDAEVGEGFVLGAAITSGTSRVSFSGSADTGRSRGNAFGVYGSYLAGPWAFKGLASLAWNTNHMDRAVVAGPLARTASSDFDSRSQSLYAEASYDLPQAGYLLQPLAALSYARTKTDGFTETGAGALNLQVAGQTTTSTRTLLGAKAVFDSGSLKVEPRLLWAHEFGNVNAPMAASLTGAPAVGGFQVSGVALKRDSLVLGLGVSGQIRKGLMLVADGQLEANARQRNLALFVALRGVW